MRGMSYMQRLEQRWDQRATGLEPMTVEASIDIACSTQELWDFLITPESAIVTGDGVVKAFRVPGTPVGAVGDQHCLMYEVDGRVSIQMSEVVEAEPPNRVVVRWPTVSPTMLAISTLTPTPTGTKYSSRLGLQVPTGTGKKVEPDIQLALAQSNVRLKACAEAGTHFSAPEE
jgi:hypothetical protein